MKKDRSQGTRDTTEEETQPLAQLYFLVKVFDYTQRSRVAIDRHFETLRERGVSDPFLAGIAEMYVKIEEAIEAEVTRIVEAHPVWKEWARAVKGCGALTLGKIMARCCRFYPGIDKLPEDKKKPCNARINGGRCGREDLHFHGIEQYDTASQLRAHAGLAPGQKLKKGQTISWDPRLKSSVWLLGHNLRLAVQYQYFLKNGRGPFDTLREALEAMGAPENQLGKSWDNLDEQYRDQLDRQTKKQGKAREFYLISKEEIRVQWERAYGPIGKKVKKDQLGDLDIDRRAMHKMMQVFMVFLWVVWRRSEGFEVRPSFAAEKLGHHDLPPEAWME